MTKDSTAQNSDNSAPKQTDAAAKDNEKKIQAATAAGATTPADNREANAEQVKVNENVDGEATNGTSQEGSDKQLDNTTSVPQNDQTDVETTPAPNDTAKEADAKRTEDEIKFADESNPNQKARNAASPDEYDQDGNPRTGGYSYGVAADDGDTVPEADNAGVKPEESKDVNVAYAEPVGTDFLNQDVNNQEWSVPKQQKLEKELSDPKKGIKARVTTSVGNYVSVLFFRNNKPMGSYESRNFKASKAKEHLSRLKKLV